MAANTQVQQVEFISFDPRDLITTHKENRRKIRIQVMKDFRRKERERQSTKSDPTEAIHDTTRPLQHIYSPALNQMALTDKLREGWAPVGFRFSTLVPPVVRSWAPVLAVIDSIKLVHMGSTVRDDQFVLEGRKRFLLAMKCLRRNLSQNPSMALPGLMLVSMGVSWNEIYSAISHASAPSFWQKQIVGMSALLLTQRPIDPSSRLETFLIARLRTAQLMHSLCSRSPFPTEYTAPSLPSHSPALDFLCDLAFKLPGLLAIVDTATASDTNELLSYDRIVRDLISMAKMLDSWLKSFCGLGRETKDEHDDSSQQLLGLSSRTLKSKPIFDLTCKSLCRICLLIIYQDLHVLHARFRTHEQDKQQWQSTAEACAKDLHATAVQLDEVAERPVCKAMALRGPLYFLRKHYQSVGDRVGLAICEEMSEDVRSRAPYLNWNSLLPWALLPLVQVPL